MTSNQRMPMNEQHREELRLRCLRNFFDYCIAVMAYDDIIESLHGVLCTFIQGPGDRKQVTLPRSYVKTYICSVAFPQWVTLIREKEEEFPYYKAWEDKFWQLGPNMRVLIASYVISNAEKMISLIRKTYESNSVMQMLFPEVIPYNFNKIRWSNESACINRIENFTESTFEAAGIGGASISRHYDLLIEDDLVYAKKDDLSGRELQPSQEDIDKAIGWHKLSHSLLVPGHHTRIHNIGTRWAKHDLIDYIWSNEPSYKVFHRGCVNMEQLKKGIYWEDCEPTWKELYGIPQLKRIYEAQGAWMFSTQYLTIPISPEECLFKREWLQLYSDERDRPSSCRYFTTIDLSEWTDRKRASDCEGVVLTCGWDHTNQCWIAHYDKGRFSPTRILDLMKMHWEKFKPELMGIESVYYQKALFHFAQNMMREGKLPYMPIRQIAPEGRESKEVRIRAIEPLASNLGLHCKAVHGEFITEFSEYVPNNKLSKRDLLDALAYQWQLARPGKLKDDESGKTRCVDGIVTVGNVDDFMKDIWDREKDERKDVFGNASVLYNPFDDLPF